MSKAQNEVKKQACVVCGVRPCGDCHHFITQGSRPDLKDYEPNLFPLCRKHHIEFHHIGATKWVKKYRFHNMMIDRGFYFCIYSNKYRLEFNDDD